MEVHHHPQLEHKPKPWKEYLLEGLMIFIAVTLGFFAESLREHIADKSKEREIISALSNDIKRDTVSLENMIHYYMPTHNRWVDSVGRDINTLPLKGNEQKITRAMINATNWNIYTPPEIALNILKNSGNFNFIKNKAVKDEILNYNTIINEYIKYSEFVTNVQHDVDTASQSFLSRRDTRKLIAKLYVSAGSHSFGFVTDSDIPQGVVFINYNKGKFLAYMTKLNQVDYLLNDLLGLYNRVLNEEKKLLDLLKTEYHLEE